MDGNGDGDGDDRLKDGRRQNSHPAHSACEQNKQ